MGETDRQTNYTVDLIGQYILMQMHTYHAITKTPNSQLRMKTENGQVRKIYLLRKKKKSISIKNERKGNSLKVTIYIPCIFANTMKYSEHKNLHTLGVPTAG